MKLVSDFYCQFSAEYRTIYFSSAKHGDTENENYRNAKAVVELFNNGCMKYNYFLVKLARCCGTNPEAIDNLMTKYIIRR